MSYWFESRLRELHRTQPQIRIGFLRGMPYVASCYQKSSNCDQPGMAVVLTRNICAYLRIACEFSVVDHGMFGDNLSGEWRGMVKQIMDHEFHTSNFNFNPTTERVKVVHFTKPVYESNSLFVTRFPPKTSFDLAGIFGFKPLVWLLILISILILAFLGVLFETIEARKIWKKPSAAKLTASSLMKQGFDSMVDVAAVFLQQEPNGAQPTSTLILFSLWGLCCIVLCGMYNGFILSTALADNRVMPFDSITSLASCVRRGQCVLSTSTISTSYFERILTAKNGSFFRLRSALAEMKQPLIEPSPAKLNDLMIKSTKTYYVKIVSDASFAISVKSAASCTYAKVDQIKEWLSYPFAKNQTLLRSLFDYAIEEMKEEGILDKIYADYVGNILSKQDVCFRNSVQLSAMTVANYYGAFLALGAGLLLASLIILLENLHRKLSLMVITINWNV